MSSFRLNIITGHFGNAWAEGALFLSLVFFSDRVQLRVLAFVTKCYLTKRHCGVHIMFEYMLEKICHKHKNDRDECRHDRDETDRRY